MPSNAQAFKKRMNFLYGEISLPVGSDEGYALRAHRVLGVSHSAKWRV